MAFAKPFHEQLKMFFVQRPQVGERFRAVSQSYKAVVPVLLRLVHASRGPLLGLLEATADTFPARQQHWVAVAQGLLEHGLALAVFRLLDWLPRLDRLVARHRSQPDSAAHRAGACVDFGGLYRSAGKVSL